MPLDYTAEKANGALHILARHTNPDLRYRIADAWIEMLPASPDLGVAEETEQLWRRIRARITRGPAIERQGLMIPTLALMEEHELLQVVEALVTVCKAVVIEHAGGTPSPFLPGYLAD